MAQEPNRNRKPEPFFQEPEPPLSVNPCCRKTTFPRGTIGTEDRNRSNRPPPRAGAPGLCSLDPFIGEVIIATACPLTRTSCEDTVRCENTTYTKTLQSASVSVSVTVTNSGTIKVGIGKLGVLPRHLKCGMKSPHLFDISWALVDFRSNLSRILADV